MAYSQKQLDVYRQLIAQGEPFKSTTCPYCNGQRDATVKHLHPSTKPADAWSFWRDVLINKYASLQSAAAIKNMESTATFEKATHNAEEQSEGHVHTASLPRMFVVGPMVDQSELPFRMLCRAYGSTLAYTPMLHAKSFAEGAAYRKHFFATTPPEEVKAAMEKASAEAETAENSQGSNTAEFSSATTAETQLADRPCIVQFCGHDADTVLAAARYAVLGEGADAHPTYPVRVRRRKTTGVTTAIEVEEGGEAETDDQLLFGCDAVDLNLGCPQGIARRGHYGSFLMEDWELIHTIIHTLHVELEVPVTAKIRVFDHPGHSEAGSAETQLKHDFDEALTILYARMIRDAGAQVLCVHGRTRDMKGQQTSVANMELICRVRRALQGSIPVISNGNVYTYDDVLRHLRDTQCEGHMCAEPLLWDPTLFSHPSHPVMPGRTHGADKATRLSALHTALVYMQWVRRYPVDLGFVKAHLFKMCFHSYELHTEFREVLGQLKTSASSIKGAENGEAQPAGTAASQNVDATRAPVKRSNAEVSSPDTSLDDGAERETEDALFKDSDSASSTAFEQHVGAIEAHLRALLEVEQRSCVDGEQPKVAQVKKAKAKEEVVDVWEAEGGLGINF
ncbi:putative dihydrouridine synthase (Dus) [Leptomonas pyrrhocoris]|uniref:tRNA-dihydrouridine(16/17) synthase [NAD(P)(+)] n=1 Tax=Leptomonas pyrrhocoris TaxID=157538 RepID=A0A0N0DUE3_LEPPY|nr:putative dihydrouridine synthase (Dus) [Leptomonas pyrrhocoris]KPA78791.1 putative dihydrouridine synthase (Dus) [Leptomonas pyrrhocoris]|eukprot:XP_015657230.1 putative dihydrouridine synthase (Dus) [Leptomonas pyrrhocoris]